MSTPACPSCFVPMSSYAFGRALGGTSDIDVCAPCHLLWFDQHESLGLSPRGVLDLFELVRTTPPLRAAPADPGHCLRCPAPLRRNHNRVAGGATFIEHRCPHGHGRLSSFTAFLIEKGFARPLTAAEVAALHTSPGPLACSACGATLDLHRDNRCLFCGMPASFLDPAAVGNALRRLHTAKAARDPAEAAATAAAKRILLPERLRVEEQRGAVERLAQRLSSTESTGVVDLLSLSAEIAIALFKD